MNFNDYINVGDTHEDEYTVKTENTAEFIGNKDVPVLSTPSMIAFMEKTAANIVVDKLPEGYRVVGTKVNINHVKPTPLNAKVNVKATLLAIEGKKLSYVVEAFYNNERIGYGEYEQYIIHLHGFLNN